MQWQDMAAIAAKAEERRERVQTIVKWAQHKGLDASFALVNRNFYVWEEWYLGRYNTGYLMRKTGVRPIKKGHTSADSS